MKWLIYSLLILICIVGVSAVSSNNVGIDFNMSNANITNNNIAINFEFYETTSNVTTSCTGTSNCVVTCGGNFTGNTDMNSYNISFSGTGTTYLLANITNYTKISVGTCNIKINGMKLT